MAAKHKRVKFTESKSIGSEINCMFTNAQSVVNKLSEITNLLVTQDIYVLGVAETWLNNEIKDSELKIEGYNIFRRDRTRSDKKTGGGVMAYVKDTISVTVLNDINDDKHESLWLQLTGDKSSELCLGICYRSPDCPEDMNQELFRSIRKYSNKNLLLMGDFNYGGIDWIRMDAPMQGEEFLNLVNDCFLF